MLQQSMAYSCHRLSRSLFCILCLKCYLFCRMKTFCILCPRKPKVQLYHEEGHSLLYLQRLPNSPTLIHTTHNLQFSVLIMKYFQKRNRYLGESMHPVLSILLTTKFIYMTRYIPSLIACNYLFSTLIFHSLPSDFFDQDCTLPIVDEGIDMLSTRKQSSGGEIMCVCVCLCVYAHESKAVCLFLNMYTTKGMGYVYYM